MSNQTFDLIGDGITSVFRLPAEVTALVSYEGLTEGLTATIESSFLVLSGPQAKDDRFTVTVTVAGSSDTETPGGCTVEPVQTINVTTSEATDGTLLNFMDEPFPIKVIDLSSFTGSRLHLSINGPMPLDEFNFPTHLVVRLPRALQEVLVDNGVYNDFNYQQDQGPFGEVVKLFRADRDLSTSYPYNGQDVLPQGISRFQRIDSFNLWFQTSPSTRSGNEFFRNTQSTLAWLQSQIDGLSGGGGGGGSPDPIEIYGANNTFSYSDVDMGQYDTGYPGGADVRKYFALPIPDGTHDAICAVNVFGFEKESVVGIPTGFKGRLTINNPYNSKGVYVVPAALVNNANYNQNPTRDLNNTSFLVPPGGQAEIIMSPQVSNYGTYEFRGMVRLSVSKVFPEWVQRHTAIVRPTVAEGDTVLTVAHTGSWVLNTFRKNYSEGNKDGVVLESLPPNTVYGAPYNAVFEVEVIGATYVGAPAWETKFKGTFSLSNSGRITVITEVDAGSGNLLGVGLRKFDSGILTVKVLSWGGQPPADCVFELLTQSNDSVLVDAA